ncbi:gene transfer agent family protein [uncultured Erythrobacter sp.]|uniref:gene transfer agent family protein n=1 Tax=uncultured Erythrobacter sp. TaxID=263913 RepID=UPI00260A2E09|nr:gene transfer agent family protein [uncultured Erythrobacter sp.]
MTNAANPLRGELAFRVGGQDFVLRPSFEALVAAEQELGSLFALVERASEGSLTLFEITALLWHCMASTARPPRDEVGEAVLTGGLVAATKPVRGILAQVLQGQQ